MDALPGEFVKVDGLNHLFATDTLKKAIYAAGAINGRFELRTHTFSSTNLTEHEQIQLEEVEDLE